VLELDLDLDVGEVEVGYEVEVEVGKNEAMEPVWWIDLSFTLPPPPRVFYMPD
jgi:hypothetical protein